MMQGCYSNIQYESLCLSKRMHERLTFEEPVRELHKVSERTQGMSVRREVSILEVSTKAFHFRIV